MTDPTLITVRGESLILPDGRVFRCAIGRGGFISADEKREGDGATPLGDWPVRCVLYRPDRRGPPDTALSVTPIEPDDGWCDAPDHPDYNCPVKRPFAASFETMWRDDLLYDVVVILGHNDDPPVPGAGSAIFLHVAKPDYSPTAGCVALQPGDLDAVLKTLGPGSILRVLPD